MSKWSHCGLWASALLHTWCVGWGKETLRLISLISKDSNTYMYGSYCHARHMVSVQLTLLFSLQTHLNRLFSVCSVFVVSQIAHAYYQSKQWCVRGKLMLPSLTSIFSKFIGICTLVYVLPYFAPRPYKHMYLIRMWFA